MADYLKERGFACLNLENEAIPPYAVMQLAPEPVQQPNYLHARDAAGHEPIWYVKKCDELGASIADAAMFVFNGPVEIPPRGRGRCHQDMPAQVLHDGRADAALKPYTLCGPFIGTWSVWAGLPTYRCLGHDRTGQPATQSAHTVWVAPSRRQLQNFSANPGLGTTQLLETGGVVFFNHYLHIQYAASASAFPNQQISFGIKVNNSGDYMFGFHLKCKSTEAPHGSPQPFQLFVYQAPTIPSAFSTGETPRTVGIVGSPWIASREQSVIRDRYQMTPYTPYVEEKFYPAENVAGTGMVELQRNDIIFVRYTGAYKVEVKGEGFWCARLHHERFNPPGSPEYSR